MMTAQAYEEMPGVGESDHMPIADQIEELFSRAEPRLLRLARLQQIAPDAAEDIVQETLLEAWKSLDHLRDETRFAAWLDGICRNVCRRHQRKQGILQAREAILDSADEEGDALAHLADPDSFDPSEELTRQDMAFLLDRALGYLTPESRLMVEQHYLSEIPQRELAARLGITLSALETRLHRARGQILRVLGNDLRADALALGLAVDPADAAGWRETRLWCIFCGQHRMEGLFDPMPDGRINLRLRCPVCKETEVNSLGMVDLANARSFFPALKKIIDESGRYFLAAMDDGGACICWICGRPAHLHLFNKDILADRFGMQTWLESSCTCIHTFTSAISVYGTHPQVREFVLGSDRVVFEPEVKMSYEGQSATRFGLLNLITGRHVYVFAEVGTLLPLGVVTE